MNHKPDNSRKTTRGLPGAVLLSVLIHAGLLLLATVLVVIVAERARPTGFEAPNIVKRPKIPFEKIRIRPSKDSRPRTPSRIAAPEGKAVLPAINVPQPGSAGDRLGVGFNLDIAFDPGEPTPIGDPVSIGNDFVGTLYDLKRARDGSDQPIGHEEFQSRLREFIHSGWVESVLNTFYRSPKKLYARHFIVPPMISFSAGEYFGQEEMACYFFFVKYEGQLVHKEDIRFRFWGTGDAYMAVRVDGRDVLANGWMPHTFEHALGHWHSSDPMNSDRYYVGNQRLKVGDWIELKAGEPVDMQILFGECHAGEIQCCLLVEECGREYPTSRQGGPLLPAFKTEEFTLEMMEDIYALLPEGECSLTNGPVFRDF